MHARHSADNAGKEPPAHSPYASQHFARVLAVDREKRLKMRLGTKQFDPTPAHKNSFEATETSAHVVPAFAGMTEVFSLSKNHSCHAYLFGENPIDVDTFVETIGRTGYAFFVSTYVSTGDGSYGSSIYKKMGQQPSGTYSGRDHGIGPSIVKSAGGSARQQWPGDHRTSGTPL
jgi:hypothetical protein